MATPHVILYGHIGCPGSDAARAYFARHAVAYQFRDISQDPTALAEWRALGAIATPVLRVGERLLFGFDPVQFEESYLAANQPGKGAGNIHG